MILYFLVAFSVGVEGGYNQPAVGFDNLNSGPTFAICFSRDLGISDITFSVETNFYQGKNPGYYFNTYGFRFQFSKSDWRFSPVLEFGPDYIYRRINKAKESGYALNYGLGFLINFQIERLRIYPKFYYEGITDFKTQAGFIGFKLGIGYEI